MTHSHRSTGRAVLTCCWLLMGLPLAGCFDADAMLNARRQVTILSRLEEVDLGKFRLTLPRPPQSSEMAEIQFHAFGQVAHRDVDQVTKTLEAEGPKLRHQLLLAARQLQLQDIEDAQLQLLRTQIATVLNEEIPGKPLQSVGFYTFGYYNF